MLFTEQRCACAAICYGYVSACPSVRQLQAGIVPKRLKVGSAEQRHTIAQGF